MEKHVSQIDRWIQKYLVDSSKEDVKEQAYSKEEKRLYNRLMGLYLNKGQNNGKEKI